MTVKGQILRSASVIAFVTAISRICGYLRDQRVALLLGTSPAADSFILAFRIPSLIRRMTGENSLGASFIPVFSGYLRDKPRRRLGHSPRSSSGTWRWRWRSWRARGGFFEASNLHLHRFWRRESPLGSRDLSEPNHFSGRFLHWPWRRWPAAILNSFHVFGLPASTPIFFNLICHRLFVRNPVSADPSLGAGSLPGRRRSLWGLGFWSEARSSWRSRSRRWFASECPWAFRFHLPIRACARWGDCWVQASSA